MRQTHAIHDRGLHVSYDWHLLYACAFFSALRSLLCLNFHGESEDYADHLLHHDRGHGRGHGHHDHDCGHGCDHHAYANENVSFLLRDENEVSENYDCVSDLREGGGDAQHVNLESHQL